MNPLQCGFIYFLPMPANYFSIPDQFRRLLVRQNLSCFHRRKYVVTALILLIRPKGHPMDNQQLLEKATEALRPYETSNLIETMQHLSVNQVFSHPAVLILIVAIFFFGVVKRSKTVLLSLFSLVCIAVIIRYAMPAPGDDLSVSSLLPFIGGGLVIGCVIIYFSLIKTD
jgi:hypothetical protein